MDRHSEQYGSLGNGSPGMDEGFHPSLVQRRRERFGGTLRERFVQSSGVL